MFIACFIHKIRQDMISLMPGGELLLLQAIKHILHQLITYTFTFLTFSFWFLLRALVDMLRHQSSPVQQDERNNSVALCGSGEGQGTLGRPPKNLYAPGLPSKDNRREWPGEHSVGTNRKHVFEIKKGNEDKLT